MKRLVGDVNFFVGSKGFLRWDEELKGFGARRCVGSGPVASPGVRIAILLGYELLIDGEAPSLGVAQLPHGDVNSNGSSGSLDVADVLAMHRIALGANYSTSSKYPTASASCAAA